MTGWLSLLSLAPAVELRVGVGMPDLAHVQLGFDLTERWSVHAVAGTNLGLLTFFGASAGACWHPWIRERGPRSLRFGVGPDLWMGPTGSLLAVIVTPSVELAWSYDTGPVSLVVAHRFGMGLTMDFPRESQWPEPGGLLVPLQLGLAF